MESDKPDLNSILENARAHLDMYGRTSQEDITEPTKEILLTRSKDQEMEDVSGPLFDKAKESAGIDSGNITSGKSLTSQDQNPEESKESKVLGINPDAEAEVEVDGDESSNKNFDSSTMTLGDQQSFQNQVELTSQTTYTNIHELTGPVKDDILVVTGPTVEPSDNVSVPSHVSQSEVDDISSETTQVTLDNIDPETMTTEDELQKPDELQHNQMAGTNNYFRGWKSDPCRDTLQENVDAEDYEHQNQRDDIDKVDTSLKAGAGTREGSPVRTNAKLMLRVAEKLSQLELHEGKQCPWNKQGICEKGIDCACEQNEELNEDSLISDTYLDVKEDADSKTENTKSCEIAPTLQNYQIDPYHNNIDNRQIEFVQYYEANEVDKSEGNVRKVSDKSIFEDEGFVDSKELVDSAKVIFISDQEDEQSCKPFETEDDTSCLLEPSSAGRSLDLQSDLEAKPSLTDVHQVQKHEITADDVITDSERAISTDGISNSNEENFNLEDRPNLPDDCSPEVPKETTEHQNYSTETSNESPLRQTYEEEKIQNDASLNKNNQSPQDTVTSAETIVVMDEQTAPTEPLEKDLKLPSTSQPLSEIQSPLPNIVEQISKTETTNEGSKVKPMCIGRAIFEAFIKNMSKTNSNSPELCKLTAILERASMSKDPNPDIRKNMIMSNKSSSGTEYESANEGSTQIGSCQYSNNCDESSSSETDTETDSDPLNPLDMIEKLANDPMAVPLIPTALLSQPFHQVNPNVSTDGIQLILNPETFIDLKFNSNNPEELNSAPDTDLFDDPQIPHISATDLESINIFNPLNLSKEVCLDDEQGIQFCSKTITNDKLNVTPQGSEQLKTVNANDELIKLPSTQSSDSTIVNVTALSDIITPIIEEIPNNSDVSESVINPIIDSQLDNLTLPEISDLIFKSIQATLSDQFKESIESTAITDLNPNNELDDITTKIEISSSSDKTEETIESNKSDHPLTPFTSELQTSSSPGPNITHYISDPPLPIVKPPSPHRLDLQITSPDDQDTEEEIDSKPPPRPPPRPRATVQTKKKKLNFFKKLFGIKAKN